MKMKKLFAIGLAAIMAISAMSINAFAMTFTDGTVEVTELSNDDNEGLLFTDGTIELQPGESIGTPGYDVTPLSTGTVYINNETYEGDRYENSFTCVSTAGKNLNIYVKNVGSVPVKFTLSSTTSTNDDVTYIGTGKDVTKRFTNSNGVSGTWSLNIESQDEDGDTIKVFVRARQY